MEIPAAQPPLKAAARSSYKQQLTFFFHQPLAMFGPPHPREYLRSNFFGTILASMMVIVIQPSRTYFVTTENAVTAFQNGVLSTQIYVYFRRHDNKYAVLLGHHVHPYGNKTPHASIWSI